MISQSTKYEEDIILNAMMPLLDAKSLLLRHHLKEAMLFWYSCHYGITDRNGYPRFQRGTNAKRGKVDADYILSTHFISDRMLKLLRGEIPFEPIRLEHIIPGKVADQRLQRTNITSTDDLRQFLISNIIIGFVTKAEDDRLNEAGYRSAMPNGIDDPNPYSRYEAIDPAIAGIKLRNAQGQQTQMVTSIHESLRTI